MRVNQDARGCSIVLTPDKILFSFDSGPFLVVLFIPLQNCSQKDLASFRDSRSLTCTVLFRTKDDKSLVHVKKLHDIVHILKSL